MPPSARIALSLILTCIILLLFLELVSNEVLVTLSHMLPRWVVQTHERRENGETRKVDVGDYVVRGNQGG
jgi:Flp pilus assembly protein TadB